jgi:hypothetical protein
MIDTRWVDGYKKISGCAVIAGPSANAFHALYVDRVIYVQGA